MIPDRVAEHLHGPSFIQVATRNAELRPAHAHVQGAFVHEDRETVTFYIAEHHAKRMVADLEDNGRVALGAAQATHEAYQMKGTYVSSRPTNEKDDAIRKAYLENALSGLLAFFPEEIARRLIDVESNFVGSVAITFRVEEIFLQTPGPNAGTKMV